MRFWDSSAVVPLLVAEPTTSAVSRLLEADSGGVVWWATGVECISAIARRERERTVTSDIVLEASMRLERLLAAWEEIQPSDGVRRTATRLLRVHPLRAADAFQLAAARAASEERPDTLPFVTLDERLALAAQREGFAVNLPIS